MSDTGEENENLCKICSVKASRYTCPRCNIPYCSLSCYRSRAHESCSESFYKESVSQELALRGDEEPGAREQMARILRDMQEGAAPDDLEDEDGDYVDCDNESQDSDDDDPVPDLAERLKGVDLDDSEAIWKLLTADEIQEFRAMVGGGDLTGMLPHWGPWWEGLQDQEKRLVQELEKEAAHQKENENLAKRPNVMKNITDYSCLSKQPPSPCVRYNLLNVLGAYTVCVRLFYGDHTSQPQEAAACVMAASRNLANNDNFQDLETALGSVDYQCNQNPSFSYSTEAKQLMREDLQCLLRRSWNTSEAPHATCALSDLYQLFSAVKPSGQTEEKKEITEGEFAKQFSDPSSFTMPPMTKACLKSLVKKLEFYMSYCQSFVNDDFYNDFEIAYLMSCKF